MAADQGLVDSVANENVKVGAGGPAFWLNTMMSAHTAHMTALQNAQLQSVQAFNAAMGRLNQMVVEEDPTDAVSKQKILSGNDLVQQLGQLGTLIAQLQQSMKGSQTTPPETGK